MMLMNFWWWVIKKGLELLYSLIKQEIIRIVTMIFIVLPILLLKKLISRQLLPWWLSLVSLFISWLFWFN